MLGSQFIQTTDLQVSHGMAGPGPGRLREALEGKAGGAAFSSSTHHHCAASPSPDRRQLVPETLANMTREGEGSRGEDSFYLAAFHLYPSGAWVICYA